MCRNWPPEAVPEGPITTLNDTVSDANAEKQCIYSVLKIDLRSSKSWIARASFGGQNDMFVPSFLPSPNRRHKKTNRNGLVFLGFFGRNERN